MANKTPHAKNVDDSTHTWKGEGDLLRLLLGLPPSRRDVSCAKQKKNMLVENEQNHPHTVGCVFFAGFDFFWGVGLCFVRLIFFSRFSFGVYSFCRWFKFVFLGGSIPFPGLVSLGRSLPIQFLGRWKEGENLRPVN